MLAAHQSAFSAAQAFHDPGAVRLANARSRAQAALTACNSTGDEIAARIRAAAGQTSDEDSGIGGSRMKFPDLCERLTRETGEADVFCANIPVYG